MEKGLSSNTVRKHHDLLRVALHTAVKQGKLGSNPTDQVEPPKVKRALKNLCKRE
ncbi:phage integrase SAM-like domain-containing protein [Klebsiella pneumoniae]|uniref:phage integrase SAM-like domain-containing protein n=1 Tax=Klebsiella pneumoniae TaxID=573 RepID=UPI003F7CE90D